MRIKKTFQTTVPTGKVLNNYTESNLDTYSCNYVNLIGKTITMNSGEGSAQNIPANATTKVINTTNEKVNQFTNDEITYSNGEYTINSDNIHTILVNVQLFFNSGGAENFGYIMKNNQTILNASITNIKNRFCLVFPVERGDKINISCYCATAITVRADTNNFSQITVLG